VANRGNRETNTRTTNLRGGDVGREGRGAGRAVADRGQRFHAALNQFRRPFREHYGRWYHGGWSDWPSYPAFWASLPGGSWLGPLSDGSDAFDYSNPYCDNDQDAEIPPGLDYAQPLEVPTDAQAAQTDEGVVREAMDDFDLARGEFRQGRYDAATTDVDRALRLLPGDRTMQEFRGLCLFARGRYDEAAAVLYAVLAQGPGWDYDTQIALYPDAETYTRQLRALEDYVTRRPDDGAARFVLAYQYLVLNQQDAAAEQLRAAARISPEDKLSAHLADALSRQPPEDDR
jgi:tetratricopeptide (TPR) repeat protein